MIGRRMYSQFLHGLNDSVRENQYAKAQPRSEGNRPLSALHLSPFSLEPMLKKGKLPTASCLRDMLLVLTL